MIGEGAICFTFCELSQNYGQFFPYPFSLRNRALEEREKKKRREKEKGRIVVKNFGEKPRVENRIFVESKEEKVWI